MIDVKKLRAYPTAPSASCQEKKQNKPQKVISWRLLPNKDQLFILFLSCLVDFLQVASLQAYVFFQLKHFDDGLSDAEISRQAGLLQGCFTGAQVLTAILWGKAADASWCGRKRVLLIGLVGTAVSCVGYGFSTSFYEAAMWRAFGGAVNGTVGITRTMIAEITVEKTHRPLAFLILPMSFNVAGSIGPILGGLLADPIKTFPRWFGEATVFESQWINQNPYALPNVINAILLAFSAIVTYLFLEETLSSSSKLFDYGLYLGNKIKSRILQDAGQRLHYSLSRSKDVPMTTCRVEPYHEKRMTGRLPFSRLWTRNVLFTLLTSALYDFHLGSFTNIWSLFLSTPRYGTSSHVIQKRSLPLLFTGGLGMAASTVGLATSILGGLGMILQVFCYPPIQARLGNLRSFRWFLFLFPVAYLITPCISILPSPTAPPEPCSGVYVWTGITLTLLLHTTARAFTLPASIILLNNCSPHPSVLGTIHGLGQSVSAAFRTVGPVVGGRWFGFGLDIGMVAWGWWGTAVVSIFACISAFGMHDGSGHEILLDDEVDCEQGKTA
ncbi:Major facilitator superfamily domain, general substrate transporter [Metarhizium rileyi]|uniref:Major facilitator superfamily domain, general substrate transporter n=1 Tax=Metarhizium rileyi (strain RCEF 4871) TaxID=1649241 RepID=A0A166X034_METRR|nr:Major facilitator superfamily domain, general substrate transporter [Metarhizium rileyi RCEF 4871]